MGQKINPTGFRLSVSRNWNSRWYASGRDFPRMLGEDLQVRDYLRRKLRNAHRESRSSGDPRAHHIFPYPSRRSGPDIGSLMMH